MYYDEWSRTYEETSEEKDKPLLIALSGKMGSGKSHFANLFVEKYGGQRLSFATPIKRMYELFCQKQMFGEDYSTKRHFCQAVGEGLREFEQDFWAYHLITNLEDGENIIVDDVRYPNEIIALKQEGFVIIRIEAPDVYRLKRLPVTTRAADIVSSSEVALDDCYNSFDHHILNDYTSEVEKDFFRLIEHIKRTKNT